MQLSTILVYFAAFQLLKCLCYFILHPFLAGIRSCHSTLLDTLKRNKLMLYKFCDIRRRISLASTMFGGLKKMWRSNKISIRTKKKLYETQVIPVLLYGSECWCLKREVSFIHSFGHFYSAPSSPLLLRGAPDYSTDTVSEFHAEAHMQL